MRVVLVTLIACTLLIGNSCANSKKSALGKSIEIPCSNIKSDKKHFRASSSARSKDLANSRLKAMTKTQQVLVNLISSTTKNVVDIYSNERQINDVLEFSEKMEANVRVVANEKIKGTAVVCEKNTTHEDGTYSTYMALEVNKDEYFNGLVETISKNDKLMQDFEQAKFREIFEKEMEKFEAGQN